MSDLINEAYALRAEWLRREGDQSWTASVLERLTAELARKDKALADMKEALKAALPIIEYVSLGRRFVDIEPYPAATARRYLMRGVLASLDAPASSASSTETEPQ